MLALAFLALAADPLPPALEHISPERARTLHGQQVTVTLFVAKPVFAADGQTMVGADEHPDGAERVAYLKGQRYDVKEGTRVTVKGTLRVVEHPGVFVGMAFVPPWTEIRVEEKE